jgi:MFS family permease
MKKAILTNPSLITIGISESVSNIGNWITMMAVYAMVVFKGDGGVAQSSGIFLAGLLPTLIFSPVAGWLCDRFDRKWLMIVSELASGLIVAGLIFTQRLELMYAILALQAISMAVMTPARQAVVPDIVDKDLLTQANAFLQQLAGIIKIIAPMLAGLILVVMNPHAAIILDVVSFGLSALILSRLPALHPHPEGKQDSSETEIQPSTGLWATLKVSSPLRLLFVGIFLSIFVIIGFDVLSPIYVRDILAGDEQFFGLAIGVIGLGTVIASVVLILGKKERNPWRDVMSGLLMLGTIAGAMAVAVEIPNPFIGKILLITSCLVGGIGNGLMLIQVSTLLQTLTPPAVLGRIGGAFQSTAVAGQMSGLLLTPLLVPGLLSMGAYFAIATLALIVLALFIAFSSRKLLLVPQSEPATVR